MCARHYGKGYTKPDKWIQSLSIQYEADNIKRDFIVLGTYYR